jgi:hypothetical protein
MTIRNRELSQFGSFIYIDDPSRDVAITTESTPYIGIGTTNPQYKLDVNGSTSISGILTVSGSVNANQFLLNGDLLTSASVDRWQSGSGNDIYRLNGNIGIGVSTIPEKLTVSGNVQASRFISTVTTGTAPFTVSSQTEVTNLNASFVRGKTPPSGDIVGTSDSQTLTNKTLTSPIISSGGMVLSGAISGSTTLRPSTVASGTLSLPVNGGTLVSTNDTSVVSSNMIVNGTIANIDISNTAAIAYSKLSLSNSITNSDISASASIAISKLAASTISGVSLGNTLNNLTAGSFINFDSGSVYNGSSARIVSVAATTANTANTVVSRDSSGNFSAGDISCSNLNTTFNVSANAVSATTISASSFVGNGSQLTNVPANVPISDDSTTNQSFYPVFTDTLSGNLTSLTASSSKLSFNPSTGTLTVIDLNSTSDYNLKTNIKTVEDSLDKINQIRGVSFNWKDTNKPSYGVIAQEIEKVLPELVTEENHKTVNYNGLIGVLIEAVKDLSREVEELKDQLNK